ncbi:MAG: SHOCT domain-containing protein [Candidatus Altiarchaeota archaeon]
MKNKVFMVVVALLFTAALASGQGMMGGGTMEGLQVTAEEVNHTKQEEAEGLEVWTKLQNREISCSSLTDVQYELLGEYFMGQSAGDYHAAMNKRMQNMMGEEGEEQMHISMGRQYSGCAQTTYAQGAWNTGPMMPGIGPGMMNGGMMGYGSYGIWSLLWLGFWALVLIGLVLLIIWLYKKTTGKTSGQTPLEILKARYAKGELTKKQFEEMKKGL